MRKILILFLPAAITVMAIVILVFSIQPGISSKTKQQGGMLTNIPSSGENTSPIIIPKGNIEGSFDVTNNIVSSNYWVCARRVNSLEQFCLKEQMADSKYKYGQGFKIEVLPGKYTVYAFMASDPTKLAFYTEYIVCGQKSSCLSHDPIVIEVGPGQTVSNVDPLDWHEVKATP